MCFLNVYNFIMLTQVFSFLYLLLIFLSFMHVYNALWSYSRYVTLSHPSSVSSSPNPFLYFSQFLTFTMPFSESLAKVAVDFVFVIRGKTAYKLGEKIQITYHKNV